MSAFFRRRQHQKRSLAFLRDEEVGTRRLRRALLALLASAVTIGGSIAAALPAAAGSPTAESVTSTTRAATDRSGPPRPTSSARSRSTSTEGAAETKLDGGGARSRDRGEHRFDRPWHAAGRPSRARRWDVRSGRGQRKHHVRLGLRQQPTDYAFRRRLRRVRVHVRLGARRRRGRLGLGRRVDRRDVLRHRRRRRRGRGQRPVERQPGPGRLGRQRQGAPVPPAVGTTAEAVVLAATAVVGDATAGPGAPALRATARPRPTRAGAVAAGGVRPPPVTAATPRAAPVAPAAAEAAGVAVAGVPVAAVAPARVSVGRTPALAEAEVGAGAGRVRMLGL